MDLTCHGGTGSEPLVPVQVNANVNETAFSTIVCSQIRGKSLEKAYIWVLHSGVDIPLVM